MESITNLDRKLSNDQDLATFLAALTIALVFLVGATLFGVFVWNQAVLDRSHSRWHLVDGTAGKPRQLVPGDGPFVAYRSTPVLYNDWQGHTQTTIQSLQPTVKEGARVRVCVRKTGQVYVRDAFENQYGTNPCRPKQAPTIASAVAIGVLLGLIAGLLSYWLIGNAVLDDWSPLSRIRSWLLETWLHRKLRSLRLRLKVRWGLSLAYRLLHGRRIAPDLAEAQRTLAQLLGMRATPDVVALREKNSEVVKQLKKKRTRPPESKTRQIDSRLDRMLHHLDEERKLDEVSEQEAAAELAQHEEEVT
jgi:hypothetical protein